MTILPMDVVMVSRYTSPILSSFTTRLEEMLDMPGFNTIPMAIALTGMFWSTSTSSGVLKQAATQQSHEAVWVASLMPMLWLAGETSVEMKPWGFRVVD